MTKEEKILAQAVKNTGITNGINNHDIDRWIVIEALRIALSKASFISSKQVVSGSLPLTDEEIEAEGQKRYGEVSGGSYHAARPMDKARFIKGAKWARDFKRQ